MLSARNLQSLRVLVSIAVFLTMACSRVTMEEGGSGSISIQIPSAEKLRASGKVGAFSVVDVSKMCFGVNVVGPGIKSNPPSSCDIERGIVAGTVAAGGTLSVEVNVGEDRVFEVYGFLRGSSSEACPAFSKESWGFPVAKIYDLGKSSPTKVTKEGGTVKIGVTLPDSSDNIIAHLSWSPSCASVGVVGGSSPGARFLDGAAVSTGPSLKARAHVNPSVQEQVSSGPSLKVRAWRVGQ